MIKDWTITFDDGSCASYFNFTSTQAVNAAVNDWYPAKRVIAWRAIKTQPRERKVDALGGYDVYSIPLD